MASKVGDRFIQVRKFAQAATKHVEHAKSSEQLKQTKLPNGIVVASIENYLPVSKIGVFLRAGARYETSENQGVTHALRNAVGLSTKTASTFAITRNTDYLGSSLTASTTRDNFVFLLENLRDNNPKTINYLIDSISKPAFKHWELNDNLYRLKVDLQRNELDIQSQLAELLHRAAFKGGLSNSLFTKSYNIGRHTSDVLNEFTRNNFTSNNTAVIGLGVDHNQLLDLVKNQLELSSVSSNEINKSKYVGGDARAVFDTKLTFATVVTEGVPLKNKKEVLILELAAKLLGQGSRISHGTGAGKLSQAVSQIAKEPFNVGALNVSYLDTGLFGFNTITNGNEAKDIIKLCVATVKKLAKDFNETDLKIGKERLRGSLFSSVDNQSVLLECMGTEASLTGQVSTAEEIEKIIDSITVQDVQTLLNKVVKGKSAIAAIGKLDNMPHAEDLV